MIMSQVNIDFDLVTNVQAANDSLLVIVPVIKEETESGLFKGERTVKEETKNLVDEIYVVSVGPLVQDKGISVGDQVLISGQVTILPESVAKCPLLGFQYASIKAYHVIATIKNQ